MSNPRLPRTIGILTAALLLLITLLAIPVIVAGRASDPFVITGSVRNKLGQPIEGARVRVQGSEMKTTSAADGRFTLLIKNRSLRYFRFAVTAGKEGWINNGVLYNPGERNLTIYLQKVPNADNDHYAFTITSPAGPVPNSGRGGMMGGRDCGNCHTTHLWEWGPSKMGQTMNNREVLASYGQFITDRRPDQENNCADCHAPIAALRNPGKTDFAAAVLNNDNLSKGIECDFCHKIKDVEVNNKAGVQAITMNRLSTGGSMMSPAFAYGPYDDVVTMPMVASYNTLFKKSEFCSSCHQDGLPLEKGAVWDVAGVYGEAVRYPLYEGGRVIPNQWTYQEWLEWQDSLPGDDPDKGRQCQDCHMNWTKDMVPYYRYIVSGRVKEVANERDPESIYPHKFEGATPARLEGAVRVHVNGEDRGDRVEVKVGVTNVNAGHRLPTGQSTRNMILLVRAETEDGKSLIQLSGPTVPSWGGEGDTDIDYAGRAGKGFARITADKNGKINVPVWRAASLVSDNRIKAKVTDESLYEFKLPENWNDEPVYITATLIYRKDFRDSDLSDTDRTGDIIMKQEFITLGESEL